eukprot:2704642-Pyramimonas_sp.AAC.1
MKALYRIPEAVQALYRIPDKPCRLCIGFYTGRVSSVYRLCRLCTNSQTGREGFVYDHIQAV